MRLHPFSLTADLVSPASGDSARTGGRKSPDVPKFFTIGQLAELLEVSTRQTRPRADARLLWAPLSKEHEYEFVPAASPRRKISRQDIEILGARRAGNRGTANPRGPK
jgi:hypothetical protein